MTQTTSKGIARDSVLKPGDDHLTDAAGVDIDSTDMPEDGVIAVHDTDEELLDAERETPIADDTRPVR